MSLFYLSVLLSALALIFSFIAMIRHEPGIIVPKWYRVELPLESVFFIQNSRAGISLAKKLSRDCRPGAIIPVTDEELEILRSGTVIFKGNPNAYRESDYTVPCSEHQSPIGTPTPAEPGQG